MDRTRPQIGLLHHVGGGNLGDDATLDVFIRNVGQRWPHAIITGISMNPSDTTVRHGIACYPIRRHGWTLGCTPALPRSTLMATVKRLARKSRFVWCLLRGIYIVAVWAPREFVGELSFLVSARRIVRSLDRLVVCGGGQLTELGGSWKFPYTLFKWLRLAKSAGVRCTVVNVGAGPLSRRLSRFFIRHALREADYVSFRDGQSLALARQIGFIGNSDVFPDSAYSLEVLTPNRGSSERGSQSMVGIAPVPYRDPRVHPRERDCVAYDDFIQKLATFALWLNRDSYSLALFSTDLGVDPLAIEDLKTTLQRSHGNVIPEICCVKSVKDLCSTIAAMDYVVTCRFHGVVFAHLLNKPVMAISHHPKVTILMNDLGLSRYCVDIARFDSSVLMDTFGSLVSHAEDIRSCMADKLAAYRSRLVSQFDELFPVCESALREDWGAVKQGYKGETGTAIEPVGRLVR
jgi:polysaccharide pyruvyl transferase WcaK-like protein